MKKSAFAASTIIAFSSTAATGTTSDAICGSKGYDKVHGYYWDNQSSLEICGVECNDLPNCKSWSYGNGECNLYEVAVKDTLISNPDSPYAFYDLACLETSPSTRVRTSTPTSTTKSSTRTNQPTTSITRTTQSATTSPSICGSKGYDKGTEGYSWSKGGTYDSCSKKCRDDGACKSFSYGNGECNLYNVPVSGNFEAVSDSPFIFYDRSCAAPTTSGTIKTTSKSLPTSSKTTSTGSKSLSTSSKTTSTPTKSSTTSAKTTQSAKTTTKSTTTSTQSSSSATPPCPLPTFVVTNFRWFNSTHNADCAGGNSDEGCLDSNGNWCDPNKDKNCTHCGIGICYTGLPTQPIGYGPPDVVSADISNIGSCMQSNPGTTPRREVGDGIVRCSGSQIQWVFYGDSNKAKTVANFQMQNSINCPDGSGYDASGSGQAAMSCTYDSGRNATCTLDDKSFSVVATQWGNAYYPSS